MKHIAAIAILAAALLVLPAITAQAQTEVNENTITRILQTSYPKLSETDIEVGMIKNLQRRVKVNLKIQDVPALLYITWQRHRNQQRWWYERNEERSLVFLDTPPDLISGLATVEPSAEEEKAGQEPEPEASPKQERVKQEPVEKPQPEKEQPAGEKQVEKTETPEEKPLRDAPEPKKAEIPQPEQTESSEPATAKKEPVPAPVEKQQPARQAEPDRAPAKDEETKAEPKPEKPEAKPADEETTGPQAEQQSQSVPPSEQTRRELQEELNRKTPSAKPGKEIKPEPGSKATEQPDDQSQPTPVPLSETESEEMEEPAAQSPFLPVPIATGPAATPREFISTLIKTVGEGDSANYANFLFRPSEMAPDIQERAFQRAVDIWIQQFEELHEKLSSYSHVTIMQVLMQKPQTPELERSTRESLKRQLQEIDDVYNYVRINLAVDNKPAYITIGGLVRTPGGWRIAGRIELYDDNVIQ